VEESHNQQACHVRARAHGRITLVLILQGFLWDISCDCVDVSANSLCKGLDGALRWSIDCQTMDPRAQEVWTEMADVPNP
jgi:hypothetical protein